MKKPSNNDDEKEVQRLLDSLLSVMPGYSAYVCRDHGKVLVAEGAEIVCPICEKPLPLEATDSVSRYAKRKKRLARLRLLRNHLEG